MMICERCGQESIAAETPSRFNTEALCPRCVAIERRHPDYAAAVAVAAEHVARGNRVYPGVGLPAGFRDWARRDHIRRVNAGH